MEEWKHGVGDKPVRQTTKQKNISINGNKGRPATEIYSRVMRRISRFSSWPLSILARRIYSRKPRHNIRFSLASLSLSLYSGKRKSLRIDMRYGRYACPLYRDRIERRRAIVDKFSGSPWNATENRWHIESVYSVYSLDIKMGGRGKAGEDRLSWEVERNRDRHRETSGERNWCATHWHEEEEEGSEEEDKKIEALFSYLQVGGRFIWMASPFTAD